MARNERLHNSRQTEQGSASRRWCQPKSEQAVDRQLRLSSSLSAVIDESNSEGEELSESGAKSEREAE